jgi:hypothetical protein
LIKTKTFEDTAKHFESARVLLHQRLNDKNKEIDRLAHREKDAQKRAENA